MPEIELPRVVIAGASSDVGKTTIALGIAGALRARGKRVVGAKCGPDFIDTSHLAAVTGRRARNLDAWLGGEASVAASLAGSAARERADIAIVEGVMGLFDGRHGSGDGSSAHVARILGAPVVLVLDCAKASTTVGAIAYGLKHFDARIDVAGAILNRVASDNHERTVRDALQAAGVPVLGVIRRNERLVLPSRHLGLVGPHDDDVARAYAAIAETVARDVDIDAFVALASRAASLSYAAAPAKTAPGAHVRVAIARDEAFWFYDEASLDTLIDAGATLVPYSPLRDAFPDVDAAFVGGGYPELHAAALAENAAARTALCDAVGAGMPVYAECGGLMYLGRALETSDGSYDMVGAVPAISTMSQKRSALRYLEATAVSDGPMFARGERVRAHEFHYSTTRFEAEAPAFDIDGVAEGYSRANVHASYAHVHLASRPAAVARFLTHARTWR